MGEMGAGPWSVRKGGTRRKSLTEHGLLIGQGMEPVNSAVLTDGQILVGQSGADPLPKAVAGDVTIDKDGVTTIGAKKITNTKIADMANNRFKGNVSGSAASPSDLTASQILDAIGATRGSILFRGAGGWSVAVPGSAGQVWTSNGAGADPTYQDATGGGAGLSDTDRRNILLDRVYQSKMLASARRVVNALATGFKGANASAVGVDSGNSSNVDTSHLSLDGYVAPTASTNTTTVDTPTTFANMGNYTIFSRTAALPNSATVTKIGVYSNSARTFKIKIGKQNSSTNYDIVHDQSVSHPGGGWIDFMLTAPFAVPASGTYNLGGYQNGSNDVTGLVTATSYIAGDQGASSGVSMSTNGSNNMFGMRYVYVTGMNDMTIVTVAQPADSPVGNARALLEYDASDGPALNTDITVDVTCDGGVNWTSATLASVTVNSQAGRTVAETADTACTAGASFAARVKTFNGKDVKIYGLSLTVH